MNIIDKIMVKVTIMLVAMDWMWRNTYLQDWCYYAISVLLVGSIIVDVYNGITTKRI